jgi:hypothetical protein
MEYVVHECFTMGPAKDPAMTPQDGKEVEPILTVYCLYLVAKGMGRYRYSVFGVREVEVNDRVQVGRKSVMDVFSC